MATNRKNGFTPSVEALEDRCLMSAGLHHAAGHHRAARHRPHPHAARHGRHRAPVPQITTSPGPAFALSAQVASAPAPAPARPAPVSPPTPGSCVDGICTDEGSFSVNALGAAVDQSAEGLVGRPAVGRGECTDLVQQALAHAGARSWYDFDVNGNPVANDNPETAPYVWGRLVATYRAGDSTAGLNANTVEPGDIIQYANVVLRYSTAGATWTVTATHHSAIVSWNLGGGQMRVLEQNAGTPNVVRRDTEDFSTMAQGTIWIYRPLTA